MALPVLICAMSVFVLAFYIYFTWTFDYWSRQNVPFEPPTVFVGNMTFLLRDHMSVFMRKLYKKFDGHDYFGIWMFREPTLVIRSPELVKEIFVTKFNYFMDRAMEADESDVLGNKCLLFLKGEDWMRLRQRLLPAFTRAKIRSILTNRMPAVTKELHKYIDVQQRNSPIVPKKLFMTYIAEVVAGNIFGIRANSMQDKNAPFLKLGRSFVEWTLLRGLEITSTVPFPNLVKLFKLKFFTKENNDYMRELFVKILESHEADKPDPKAHSRDFVDALLQMKNRTDFTEDDIIAQAGLFFFAGLETTYSALSTMVYELAFAQTFQESLYQQIKNVRAEKPEVDFDELDDMTLLEMAIKETLRKYPAVSFSDRRCGQDCELSNGLVVKKGMKVLVCTSGLHNDEKYFPEPDVWNPYRFEKELVPFTFIPFSDGQRFCIGSTYAMLSMKWTMASLILRYRFEPCTDTVPPSKMHLNPYAVLCAPANTIKLNFIRR